MVVYDDLEPHEKLRIYDKRVSAIRETDTFGDSQFAYHYGSVVSPFLDFDEPLRIECQHFIECVQERREPMTDARAGHRVVQVIDAAQRSLGLNGLEVAVARPLDVDELVVLETNGHNGNGNGNRNGNGDHHPIPDAVHVSRNGNGNGAERPPAEPAKT
jgi:hypothetical protein